MAGNWTPEKLERMSQHVVESALHNRDQSASWQRWVMAACLTINGGATIAALNLSEIKIYETSRFWAIVWFVAGMLATIGFGIISSIQAAKFGGYYLKSSWVIRNISDQSAGEERDKIDIPSFDNLLKQGRCIFWVQFIGLLCFVMGVGVAVEGLK